ncbi:MAG: sigma-70 family RNA polymerase sigma factor [Chloroflexota bacterium]|nr:sigma-70 family RNA polymerase sigma factor [Chloroflexota bacterium]
MLSNEPGTVSSDADLMAAVCRQESAALQELYDRYFRRAYALALRMLGNGAAAEDCVQDVFLKVWQKPHLYDPQRGAFVSWFLTLVHHNSSNFLRRVGRTQPLDLSPTADGEGQRSLEPADRSAGGSSVEDSLAQAETQKMVRAALAELSAPQRRVLELAYFGGMSQSEIAAHLKEPLGTVKTRIRTGMLKLRTALETQGWSKDLGYG